MKESPIIFSAESVRSILSAAKTQTRRVVPERYARLLHRSETGLQVWTGFLGWRSADDELADPTHKHAQKALRGHWATGERLWVRESFATGLDPFTGEEQEWYRADQLPGTDDLRWTSPLFMPRAYSRLTLEVTGVRVERLNDITREDCQAEGHPMQPERSKDPEVHLDAARDWFMDHWDSINGKKHPWKSNCWVWVIEFRAVQS